MSIKDFKEKNIRDKILKKIKPEIKSGKHDKAFISVDGKVKIPNSHDRTMKESKSKYISKDLHLIDSEFNDLIDCRLTGPKYYDLLRKRS